MKMKQVIVMRKDLAMNRGKQIAQGSHASMAWLLHRLEAKEEKKGTVDCHTPSFSSEEYEWMTNAQTKICVYVESEEELLAVYQKAIDAGLMAHLITDSGKTYFNGVATRTCCAIGPDSEKAVDLITGHLKLY